MVRAQNCPLPLRPTGSDLPICSFRDRLSHLREEISMRGSGMIWTIVGVLLVIALLIWILSRV